MTAVVAVSDELIDLLDWAESADTDDEREQRGLLIGRTGFMVEYRAMRAAEHAVRVAAFPELHGMSADTAGQERAAAGGGGV